jgi:hypothetical protein
VEASTGIERIGSRSSGRRCRWRLLEPPPKGPIGFGIHRQLPFAAGYTHTPLVLSRVCRRVDGSAEIADE